MKKIVSLILALIVSVAFFAGCSNAPKQDNGKFSVVTTIFPEYDWVSNITSGAGDVELTLLLDNGADLHSYQPTADDIIKISKIIPLLEERS